ncbi:hypothetical protein D3C87_2056910 [compost metagenome]
MRWGTSAKACWYRFLAYTSGLMKAAASEDSTEVRSFTFKAQGKVSASKAS